VQPLQTSLLLQQLHLALERFDQFLLLTLEEEHDVPNNPTILFFRNFAGADTRTQPDVVIKTRLRPLPHRDHLFCRCAGVAIREYFADQVSSPRAVANRAGTARRYDVWQSCASLFSKREKV
jgi:hypothetical protein